jgi:hypothetical protein
LAPAQIDTAADMAVIPWRIVDEFQLLQRGIDRLRIKSYDYKDRRQEGLLDACDRQITGPSLDRWLGHQP